MTPTNTAMTPEIKNIADNNGDKHTVVPTPHTHSQDDVDGLATALAAKQNTLTFDTTPTADSTNPVTSGGVKTALNGKMDNKTIDSTPQNQSTHLVSSKGVYDELAGKMSNSLLSVKLLYDNNTGELTNESNNILQSLNEGKIATALLEISHSLYHSLLGAAVVLVKWDSSATGVFRNISIYTNEAIYILSYKVEDGTWRALQKESSSIASYLPE